MEFKEVIITLAPFIFGFLSFVAYHLYKMWINIDILINFKDQLMLRTGNIEQQVAIERQERMQMIAKLEQRIYDLMSDFKKDVKEDFKSIEDKLEKDSLKDESWKKSIDDKITLLLTNRGVKYNEN